MDADAARQKTRKELDEYYDKMTSIQKKAATIWAEAEPDQVDAQCRERQLAKVEGLLEEARGQAQGPSETCPLADTELAGSEAEGSKAEELQDHSKAERERVLIVCDGTIACGKTTFLNEIEKSLPKGVTVVREPVNPTCEKSWWYLLAKFYEAVPKIKNAKTEAERQARRCV